MPAGWALGTGISRLQYPTLVVCPKKDFTFADLIEDGVNGSAPHERLRVCIVMGHVVFDGYHQFLHAAKGRRGEGVAASAC